MVALTFSFIFPDLFYLGSLVMTAHAQRRLRLAHPTISAMLRGIPQLLETGFLTRESPTTARRLAFYERNGFVVTNMITHEGRPDLPGPARRYCDAGAPGGSLNSRPTIRPSRVIRTRPCSSARRPPSSVRPGNVRGPGGSQCSSRGWRPEIRAEAGSPRAAEEKILVVGLLRAARAWMASMPPRIWSAREGNAQPPLLAHSRRVLRVSSSASLRESAPCVTTVVRSVRAFRASLSRVAPA